jgi:hypothetical protein
VSTPDEIADALEAAAGYIEVHGWCHEGMFDDDGAVCPIYALSIVCGPNTELAWVAYEIARQKADGQLVAWNEANGRTRLEVIDLLRLAAKDVRAKAVPT